MYVYVCDRVYVYVCVCMLARVCLHRHYIQCLWVGVWIENRESYIEDQGSSFDTEFCPLWLSIHEDYVHIADLFQENDKKGVS